MSGNPNHYVDNVRNASIVMGMRNTLTEAEKAQVQRLAAEAITNARKAHNQWHWNTKQTACPWGCGDGSGITTR